MPVNTKAYQWMTRARRTIHQDKVDCEDGGEWWRILLNGDNLFYEVGFFTHELINQKLRPKGKSRAWLWGGKDRDINGSKAEGTRAGGCWACSGTSKEVSVAGGE